MSSFDDENPMKGNRAPRPEEQTHVLELTPDEFISGRMAGPINSAAYYWFDIIKKDGTKTQIPRLCLDYDPNTQKMVRDICPYRASGKGRLSQVYFINFLVRDLQEAKPRKKNLILPNSKERKKRILLDDFECYIKEFDSKTWTPWRTLRMTSTLAEKAINLKSLNVHRVKGSTKKFPITHPKYGMDVSIMYSPAAKGSAKYDIQRGDRTALTEEELNYPMQPLDLSALKPFKLKEALKDWKELKKVVVSDDDEDEDADNKESNSKSKKNKNKAKDRDKERNSSNKKSNSSNKKASSSKNKESRRERDKSAKSSSKSSKGKSSNKKGKKNKQFNDDWSL